MSTLNDDLLRQWNWPWPASGTPRMNWFSNTKTTPPQRGFTRCCTRSRATLATARYWYRRADRMDHVADEPRAELAAIKAELTTDEHR